MSVKHFKDIIARKPALTAYSALISKRLRVVYLDFEYRQSSERHPELVCAALKGDTDLPAQKFWLRNASDREQLTRLLRAIQYERTIVSWNVVAEARCLLALGLDAINFSWIDLMIEFKQLKNSNDKFKYGPILKNGERVVSTPPNRRGSSEEIGNSKDAALYAFLNLNIHEEHTSMVDTVLRGAPFTCEEVRAIMLGCALDVEYLPQLTEKIFKQLQYTSAEDMELRGRYAAATAYAESNGIPLNLERVRAVSTNYPLIRRALIEELNETFPFYSWNPKTSDWVLTEMAKRRFVEQSGYASKWDTTTRGYSFDEKYLSRKWSHLPAIAAYLSVQKRISHVKWFRPEGIDEFLKHVGSDGRLRPWHNPFGTQTGRNAPPAKQFIFAMASWMRALVEPFEGETIYGIDYRSQEFAIAAYLSRDTRMRDAYLSGDPYMGFLKASGRVPKDAKREDYEDLRNQSKSAILGIQFGMGVNALDAKICADMGIEPKGTYGKRWLQIHQSTFKSLWQFREFVSDSYKQGLCIRTKDNYVLYPDNPSILSVGNYPIQGTAADVNRRAAINVVKAGLPLMCTLHDACYINPKAKDDCKELFTSCMDAASKDICGDWLPIYQDISEHKHGEYWIEAKGRSTFERIQGYLEFDADLV